MGPGLEWVAAAYSGRPQITLPNGLGDTTDFTLTLSVLKLAGLPRGDRVARHDPPARRPRSTLSLVDRTTTR